LDSSQLLELLRVSDCVSSPQARMLAARGALSELARKCRAQTVEVMAL
jgi:hypothetical protein